MPKIEKQPTQLAIFKGKKIRRTIFQKEWWFSVVDVIQVLLDQTDNQKARKYWNKLAQRLRDEGSEVVTNCHRLKLEAPNGKMRETDCAITCSGGAPSKVFLIILILTLLLLFIK